MSPLVKLVNTNHGEVIRGMLGASLQSEAFGDTVLHFPDSGGRTLMAHRIVLSSASPLLRDLLLVEELEEPIVHVSLPGVTLEDASRILSLIYEGSMRVPQASILKTSQIIELLRLKVQNEADHDSSSKKVPPRPLLMKSGRLPRAPYFLVLPPPSPGGPSLPPPRPVVSQERKKKRFKCEECGRCFSLACLLKRHQTIHSGVKPHSCAYCEKKFTSASSLRHHEFSKHLEERNRLRKEAQRIATEKRASQCLRMQTGENSMDRIERVMNFGEEPLPVTVLDTSQTEMDTVIEIVDTSSASEDSGITSTYSVRSSTPTEALINVAAPEGEAGRSVFWRIG